MCLSDIHDKEDEQGGDGEDDDGGEDDGEDDGNDEDDGGNEDKNTFEEYFFLRLLSEAKLSKDQFIGQSFRSRQEPIETSAVVFAIIAEVSITTVLF